MLPESCRRLMMVVEIDGVWMYQFWWNFQNFHFFGNLNPKWEKNAFSKYKQWNFNKKILKIFDLGSKFVKIWKFLKEWIFPLFLKIITFTKTAVKFRVLRIFSQIFFAKYDRNVVMKNVQELYFCSKNDQIMSMSNKPK